MNTRGGANTLKSILLCFFPVAISIMISGLAGPYSWDDGAITLAFGQTLFESGEFALTPSSPRVEGSSSLLYTILNGAIIWAGGLDFYDAINASRILSALFLGATAFLLFKVLSGYMQDFYAFSAALIYCIIPVNYMEVYNGMEMNAFAFLLVLYFHLLRTQNYLALAVLPFLVLVRIEAGFYLLVVLLLSWWIDTDEKNRYRVHLLAVLILISVLQLFRISYFGSFLPNTVLAKMHEPYSYEGLGGISLKIQGLVEFLQFYAVPIAALLIVLQISRWKARLQPEHLLILAFGFFALLSGSASTWGYDARMTLALLPTALVAVAYAGHMPQGEATRSFSLAALLVGLTIGGYAVATMDTSRALLSRLETGARYSALAEADVSNQEPSAPYEYGWYGITPENYRITGEAVEELSSRLGLDVIAFATPDVGGVGLCCSRLMVLDMALLTNPTLAANGYAHFEVYLTENRPDVIETHGVWSEVTRIYDGAYFQENYVPLVFRNTLFYLRQDHADVLLGAEGARIRAADAFDWETVRYGGGRRERTYVASVGSVIEIP